MREALRDPERIKHMLEAISNVKEFRVNLTEERLSKDKLYFFAIVKNLEIIGEAVYKTTKELKAAHPEIPWKKIEGLRHVLVHDYYRISASELWILVNRDLDVLEPQLIAIQKTLSK